jgi:hypothetical protein
MHSVNDKIKIYSFVAMERINITEICDTSFHLTDCNKIFIEERYPAKGGSGDVEC